MLTSEGPDLVALFFVVFRRRNYREAIQLLNKALEDEKTEAGLYVNRGGEPSSRDWCCSL